MRWQIPGMWGLSFWLAVSAVAREPDSSVQVELFEGISVGRDWEFDAGECDESFFSAGMGWSELPHKYDARGLRSDRSNPLQLRATARVTTDHRRFRLLLRAKNAARVYVDDQLVVETAFLRPNADGHEQVPDLPASDDVEGLFPLAAGHQQKIVEVEVEPGEHVIVVVTVIGGKNLRAELGELVVGLAELDGPFRLAGARQEVPLDAAGWAAYTERQQQFLWALNNVRRREASPKEDEYWRGRHAFARSVWQSRRPRIPSDERYDHPIDRYIAVSGAYAASQDLPLSDDLPFLRRVTLDTVGVIPSLAEIDAFLEDNSPHRREHAIDRLLADPRWADHWVAYWQDLLAENPGLVKPKLNNTGPFRWWIYESFLDNKPIDRFATELIMMRGSQYGGGPAGFAMATENDLPMAAKAHVIAKAFLAIEMKCARCHDAPTHEVGQEDTFRLAAMLQRAALTVPETSTVPLEPGGRIPAIEISLQPGDRIEPGWPFAELLLEDVPEELMQDPADWRERAAATVTAPHNRRFAQVIVNRLWNRYLGWSIVEPVDDWELASPSHPELLDFLAFELVDSGYDLKHVARLILTSRTYQRRTDPLPQRSPAVARRGPDSRRLSAEQIVDSLVLATGKDLCQEILCLDPEGRRPVSAFLNLGRPQRAWQMAPLANERDRPALSMPEAQSIVDVLASFGWRDSRQDPTTVRETAANVRQPLILANGVFASRVVRLCDQSTVTELALQDLPVEAFVTRVFELILTRRPTRPELDLFADVLREGYDQRRTGAAEDPRTTTPRHAVSWSNHLSPEATRIKLELEKLSLEGAPPTHRLTAAWRERAEDALWALVNSPEFLFVP